MKKMILIAVLCLVFAGCQDVTLRGQAMSAAENSTLHAFEAHKRFVEADGKPVWAGLYLKENAVQWRSFVRAAKKSPDWGKELDK